MEGSGKFSIGEDGTITCGEKFPHIEQNGASLTIKGGPGICLSNGRGGFIHVGGSIYVNGKAVVIEDSSKAHKDSSKAHKDSSEVDTSYVLDSTCVVEDIKIRGNASLVIVPPFLSTTLVGFVRGNGTLFLPSTVVYDHLDLFVQGNGDIKSCLGNVTTKSLLARVQGNGDIENIHALDSASLTVQGNGDIKVFANPKTIISKNVTGYGSIRVQRV